jgi:glycosyltransferase involved in cell wall biosynthesis
MDASIIVCTHNRAESLRDTLRALRAHNDSR